MMKRILTVILAICMMPICASAQWYLFPGKKKAEAKETKDTTAVQKKDTTKTVAGDILAIEDAIEEEKPGSFLESAYFLDMPSVINITIALPLGASTAKPSENFLEMYSGALLGIRDLSKAGRKMALKVIDTADGAGLTAEDIENSDVILGPVSYNDIVKALPLCTNERVLISPLDQKARDLVDSMAVVQTPSHWRDQVDAMVSWLQADLNNYKDEVIVLKDSTAAGFGEQASYLMSKLQGMKYRTMNSLSAGSLDKFHKYRILIASDRDSYIASMLRSISASTMNGNHDVTLYGTTKTRNSSGVNVMDLHNCRAVLAMSYFIDYDSQDVKDFILAYRALYHADPGSFAFQGYDAMKYYVTACSRFGRQWYKRLPAYSYKGLQSDFKFEEIDGPATGRKNYGVRKVIFNRDLSTTLDK